MAFRLAALGRQAVLSGGLSNLFDGVGNNLNIVFKTGSVPADVDTVSPNSTIASLAAADEGASNVNGTYADPSDDATDATAEIRNPITGNASADHDYDSGGDDSGIAEIFVGSGRTTADKVGDLVVGSANSTSPGNLDFLWASDTIVNGGLLTITALTLTQS